MKAIQYRRVSTKEQDDRGFSPETQAIDNLAYAQRSGFEVVADFFDDQSGMILERPGLTAARRYMAENGVKVLIAHNNDRISRHPLHYTMLRDEWEGAGVELHYSLRGKVEWGFAGQVSEDIYGRFAKEWHRRILENTRAGKRTKVAAGNVIVSQRPPYGYTYKDNRLIIDEKQAAIVRLIFTMYVQGRSMQAIADHLTALRVPSHADLHTKAGPRKKNSFGFWHHKVIRQMLINETYRGVWYWGKVNRVKFIDDQGRVQSKTIFTDKSEWIAVEVPAIVDETTWNKAQRQLTLNKERASRNTRHQYLLARRIKCGFCGRTVYAIKRSSMYYYCSSYQGTKHTGPKCGLCYHRVDLVENAVWYYIKRILQNPKHFCKILNTAMMTDEPAVQLDTEIERLSGAITQKKSQLHRLLLTWADDIEADDIKAARAEIQAEIKDLEAARQPLIEQQGQAQNSRDVTLEMSTAYLTIQSALADYDDEPFEIRDNWIKAFNLTLEMGYQANNNLMRVTCDGEALAEVLSIEGYTLASVPRNLTYTIDLSQFKRTSEEMATK